MQPEPAAAPQVGRAPADRDRLVARVGDLDVQRRGTAFEHQVQLGARVRAAVAHTVGHELGDQQGDIGQNVFRDAAAQFFADQTTGTGCCVGASGNVGLEGERLHT